MKTLIALLLLTSALVMGQNAPLPTQTWSTTFTAVAIPGNQTTLAATVADIGISPTPNSTIMFETLQSPSAPNFAGAYGPAFAYRINKFSTWLNNMSPNLSGYRFRFSLLGSGLVINANGNHYGGTARFRTEYALGTSGTWNLGVEVGAARLPGVAPKWGKLVAVGLPINF